jgi:hypothetical protein
LTGGGKAFKTQACPWSRDVRSVVRLDTLVLKMCWKATFQVNLHHRFGDEIIFVNLNTSDIANAKWF